MHNFRECFVNALLQDCVHISVCQWFSKLGMWNTFEKKIIYLITVVDNYNHHHQNDYFYYWVFVVRIKNQVALKINWMKGTKWVIYYKMLENSWGVYMWVCITDVAMVAEVKVDNNSSYCIIHLNKKRKFYLEC